MGRGAGHWGLGKLKREVRTGKPSEFSGTQYITPHASCSRLNTEFLFMFNTLGLRTNIQPYWPLASTFPKLAKSPDETQCTQAPVQ